LAPLVVAQVFALVQRIRAEGLTVLIVEQNVTQVLRVVDRAYVLDAGHVVASGRAADLASDPKIRAAFLGGH
jgi:branched-chain amino acid transport system ATP-binding protein